MGGEGNGWNIVVDAGWFEEPANEALSNQVAAIVCCGNATYTQELDVNYQSNMLYTLQLMWVRRIVSLIRSDRLPSITCNSGEALRCQIKLGPALTYAVLTTFS